MTLIVDYPTKKELKASKGEQLRFTDPSMLSQTPQDYTGTVFGCNRPHITGHKREFFAQIQLDAGKIVAVS
jgi:hypothetical protein